MAQAIMSAVDKPTRRRRWLRNAVVALLVLIGPPVGYYLYVSWTLKRDLADAIAETEQLDPRWRLADIEADREKYEDRENSALQVTKATRLVGRNSPSWHPQHFRIFGELPAQAQLNDQQIGIIREHFEKCEEGLAAARKLKDMPVGRYPITLAPGGIGTLLPNQQDARRIFTVLEHDAMLRAQQGDLDGAFESCLALLNAARSIGDEPFLASWLIRMTGDSILFAAVERSLAQGQASVRSMTMLQKRLTQERADLLAHWTAAIRGERAGHHELFLELPKGTIKMSVFGRPGGTEPGLIDWLLDRLPVMYTKDYPQHLRHMNDLVAASKLPLHEQPERFRVLQQSMPNAAFTMKLVPDLTKSCNGLLRTQAYLAATEAAVACERYRLKNQHWPDSLDELVKTNWLDAVPADPFDGQPLRLARVNDGLVIYSVGQDTQDNGGNLQRDRPLDPGVDLGVRLWDVKQRRQPPRPPVALEP